MSLYFLRHGIAEDRQGWTEADEVRPLTDTGKKNLVKQAEVMAALNLKLDLILTSPLVRAYATAAIVARRLNLEVIEDRRLAPGFGIPELVELLRDHPRAENILLVGHEPDFSQTLSALIGGGRLVCKKAGLARVDLFQSDPPQGELVWLIPPRILL